MVNAVNVILGLEDDAPILGGLAAKLLVTLVLLEEQTGGVAAVDLEGDLVAVDVQLDAGPLG